MNERIQELAEQAGYLKDSFGIGHWDMPECKKFAELIVRECVKIAYQNDIAKFTRDGYQIGMDIQKHFGVEE
jgi:hypothetical protein